MDVLREMFGASHNDTALERALSANGSDLERTVNALLVEDGPPPVASAATGPSPTSSSLAVLIPEGVRPGDVFAARLPTGAMVQLRAPENAHPGDYVRIAPSATAAAPPLSTPPPPVATPPAPPALQALAPQASAPQQSPAEAASSLAAEIDASAELVELCEAEILAVQREMEADLGASASALIWEQVTSALDAEESDASASTSTTSSSSSDGVGAHVSRVGCVALLRSAFRARRAAEVRYRTALDRRASRAGEAAEVLTREESLVLDALRRHVLDAAAGDRVDARRAALVVDDLLGPPAATRHASSIARWIATRDAAIDARCGGPDARVAFAQRRPAGWSRVVLASGFLRSEAWRVFHARACPLPTPRPVSALEEEEDGEEENEAPPVADTVATTTAVVAQPAGEAVPGLLARLWSSVVGLTEATTEADAWRARQQQRRVARALEGRAEDADAMGFAQCAEMVEAERRARAVADESAADFHNEL